MRSLRLQKTPSGWTLPCCPTECIGKHKPSGNVLGVQPEKALRQPLPGLSIPRNQKTFLTDPEKT